MTQNNYLVLQTYCSYISALIIYTTRLVPQAYMFRLTEAQCQIKAPLTYFPQFNGALKLLASNYEQHSQVDTRVESGLQLKTFSVPAGNGWVGMEDDIQMKKRINSKT